jgi:hypothetical protein
MMMMMTMIVQQRTIFLCVLLMISSLSCEASSPVWSYFSSSSSSSSNDVETKQQQQQDATLSSNNNNNNMLVSPIVNREIEVSVKAKWPSSSQHSVLCEAFVFLNDYAFLDVLTQNGQGRDRLVTFEKATQYAIEITNTVSPDTSPLLKVGLAMRYSAPACELHRSITDNKYKQYTGYLEAFVVVPSSAEGGETIIQTSADIPASTIDLPILTKEERKSLLLPNEYIRKGRVTLKDIGDDVVDDDDDKTCTSSSYGFVILYARLGGHSFPTFYRRLVELEIPFVVRHMGGSDGDESGVAGGDPEEDKDEGKDDPYTMLQGYGVRLDIRNVEYKVFDDVKRNNDDNAGVMINLTSLGVPAASEENEDGSTRQQDPDEISSHFLAGVNLTALSLSDDEMTTVYDLQTQLWKLHERYEIHQGIIPPNWQRRQLSLQAASVIAHSEQPLLTLQHVSQNLPSVASTLVHVTVPEEISTFVPQAERALQHLLKSSGGGLWINGRTMFVERPSFNVFEMIKLLKEEHDALKKMELGLKPFLKTETALKALQQIQQAWIQGDIDQTDGNESNEDAESSEEESASENKGRYRIDLATGDEGSVIYMNDLEKDQSYSRWTTSVQQMFMAMQYGMPPSLRRNLFTIVVVDDPLGDTEQNLGEMLVGQLAQQQYPARLGVVVASKEDIVACTEWVRSGKAAFDQPCPIGKDHWLSLDDPPPLDKLKTIKATARDFHRMYAYMRETFADQSEILIPYELYLGSSMERNPPNNGEFYSVFDLLSTHNELLSGFQMTQLIFPVEEIARALQENEEDSKQSYAKAVRFAVDKGVKPGMSFINGRPLPMDADDADKLQQIFAEEQQLVFGMIMDQRITDTKPRNFYYKLIKGKKKDVFPRLHPLLTTSADGFAEVHHSFGAESLLSPQSMKDVATLNVDAVFLFEAVLELDTPQGLEYALDFLKTVDSFESMLNGSSIVAKYRIIPSTVAGAKTDLCKILSSAGEIGLAKTKEILESIINNPESQMDLHGDQSDSSPCSDLSYLESGLPSANFITANGRVYSMEGEPLSMVDIELLTTINLDPSTFVSKLLQKHADVDRLFDVVARTTSFLMSEKGSKNIRSSPDQQIASLQSSLGVSKNFLRFSWNEQMEEDEGLRIQVTAIVDPVTETAQRLSPLLIMIRDELKLPLTMMLAPRSELDGDSKIPITSYYRFVADPSAYQGLVGSPVAHFSNLPTGHVLTLRMDVPEPWDVQQSYAIQDTDNLRCDLESGCGDNPQNGVDMLNQKHKTKVEYGLEHLLFFGQCYDTKMSPPNGLQLVLSKQKTMQQKHDSGQTIAEVEPDGSVRIEGSEDSGSYSDSHYSDTLVMKTVGYWQLRANPGVWDLQINQNSRAAEIFQMVKGTVKHGMLKVTGTFEDNKKQLAMGDFVGGGQLLLVKRKPGYEKANLFYDDKNADTKGDDVVHVFSLATGHLYERFLKIMILSVTKRTSTKVKFWLFENFLSPTFKASSQAMAKRIGCEIEFVTYKWPEWLRGQSEKQRIIWGYKILFLDVLFPLDVKKIIYVDSDQVVRGDLKELWDMDLQGAPYGYTPMCSSNEATLGFQFWRQGFCKYFVCGSFSVFHTPSIYITFVNLGSFSFCFVLLQGKPTSKASHTTFLPFTSSILKNSERIGLEILFERSIMLLVPIQTALQIWTKIYQIMHSIRSLFFLCHRNGYGANHGVPTKQKQLQKRLIYVITHSIRNLRYPWQSES